MTPTPIPGYDFWVGIANACAGSAVFYALVGCAIYYGWMT